MFWQMRKNIRRNSIFEILFSIEQKFESRFIQQQKNARSPPLLVNMNFLLVYYKTFIHKLTCHLRMIPCRDLEKCVQYIDESLVGETASIKIISESHFLLRVGRWWFINSCFLSYSVLFALLCSPAQSFSCFRCTALTHYLNALHVIDANLTVGVHTKTHTHIHTYKCI